jgi:DNA mismatch repair protein MutS
VDGSDGVTPMMAQYLEIKAAHPDALLFYRMGDFYELFFADAQLAAEALDIALTRRGLHLGQPIPMCGVPVVSAEGYLQTLIRKGFRVAVAEQVEDPAAARRRGPRAVLRRSVVRVVTPGTLTEDSLLEPRRANWLAAWAELRGEGGLAWADISTGELRTAPCPLPRLAAELARLAPRELLLPPEAEPRLRPLAAEAGAVAVTPDRAEFDSEAGARRLGALFGVAASEAFGGLERPELAAVSALLGYLELTQRGRLPRLRPPQRELPGGRMAIDAATRRSLELTRGAEGGREGSLLAAVDRTLTAAGGRLLERRLAAPSCDLAVIRARQEAVAALVADGGRRRALRAVLRRVPDIDRALSRLALARGGPRDLAALRAGLAAAGEVAALLEGLEPLAAEAAALRGHAGLAARLAAALVADPPLLTRDGGFVAAGFDAALDSARRLRDDGRGVIAALQADYVAETGIASLKIRHNNVLGYFVETTATHGERMLSGPLAARFVHRQTTAGQLRFTTAELGEVERRILSAADEALEIEKRHFLSLSDEVLAQGVPIGAAAGALAAVDVAAAWAELAAEEGWVRPEVDDSRALRVTAGRHPVVEPALRRRGGAFVANDCALSDGATPAIWLLTGPNMAGKSTFLRQNALIAVLAQCGAFVPAAAARIGLVGALYSRVGAADDLARGRSTFMVEMVETAAILNQADDRSLVILDEIGRGTATWDGLSIAWAVLEHLQAVNRCRALFATHYHELTALAGRLPGVANATMRVSEWQGDVVFLHAVQPGAADRSYGVQVARLAGLPAAAVARAREVLARLEQGDRQGGVAALADLPLFRAPAGAPDATAARPAASAVEARLRAVNPDDLTPRAALELLYALRAMLPPGP